MNIKIEGNKNYIITYDNKVPIILKGLQLMGDRDIKSIKLFGKYWDIKKVRLELK